MLVLGIETSCDETASALYDSNAGLLADTVHSQSDLHTDFGGVVPELAARDHIRKLVPVIQQTCAKAQYSLADLDAVAYTAGPGLVGALLTGATFGRSLAWALSIPALAVHHMEGHLLSPLLEKPDLQFPFLALLISGGHTLLVQASGLGDYKILGESVDDAVGEAFDKTAKLLGLAYPGGPALAQLAEQGQPGRFQLPLPMTDKPGLNFSFSGLKTHVMVAVKRLHTSGQLNDQTRADMALAFQTAVVKTLLIKCQRAKQATGLQTLVIAGGVSANKALRQALNSWARKEGGVVYYPGPGFCTDNGAMIAFAGCLRLQAGEHDDLMIKVKPRWSLIDLNPPGTPSN